MLLPKFVALVTCAFFAVAAARPVETVDIGNEGAHWMRGVETVDIGNEGAHWMRSVEVGLASTLGMKVPIGCMRSTARMRSVLRLVSPWS
ncbi:hypothetical protein B0H13DRAFT_2050595, partial [Mycena leptocephala]